jgi:hypothetical protein
LAAADLLAGLYLIGWAYRRQERDKPAVLIVGCVLAVCAVALLVLSRPQSPPPRPTVPAPVPSSGVGV